MVTRIALTLCVLAALVALLTPSALSAEKKPDKPDRAFAAGEVLVRPREKAGAFALEESRRAIDAQRDDEIGRLRVQRWRVPEGKELEGLGRLSRDPEIEWAQLNHIVRAMPVEDAGHASGALPMLPRLLPNDPDLPLQWALPQIRAFEAWDTTSGDPGILVAVVDTGFDLSHPDRPVNLLPGYDFVQQDTLPQDEHGHGTHVTGIIAAATGNEVGIAGVSSRVSIMELRVLDGGGEGSEYDVARAINYAVDKGARIVNLSLGGTVDDPLMREASLSAYENGVLLVASAGNCADRPCPGANETNPMMYPAAYPGVLAVGAMDQSDAIASFSERQSYVALAAPGVGVYSTYRYSGYTLMSGTSMAAPHVAGVAALAWAANPSLGVEEVTAILKTTARDIGLSGWDNASGWGCVDARAAVSLAEQGLRHLYLPLTAPGSAPGERVIGR